VAAEWCHRVEPLCKSVSDRQITAGVVAGSQRWLKTTASFRYADGRAEAGLQGPRCRSNGEYRSESLLPDRQGTDAGSSGNTLARRARWA